MSAQQQFAELGKRHLPGAGSSNHPDHAYARGDLDGDGDQDLVTANVSGRASATRLYLNDGNGVFFDATEGRLPADGELCHEVALADVDGDGDLDMVLARLRQDRLYLNDGSGHFLDATSGRLPPDSTNSSGVTLVDVDGDLDRDLLVAKSFGQADRLYLNDGTGVFAEAPPGRLPTNTLDSTGIVAGDVDGDADLDLILFVQTQARLYLNDGTGRFADESAARLPHAGGGVRRAELADVDADGDLDMALALTNGHRFFANDGAGNFTDESALRLPPSTTPMRAVAFEDVDADGDVDLVWGTDRGVLLYRNLGAGSFTDVTSQEFPVGGSASTATIRDLQLFDVDVDGDADLVAGAVEAGLARAFLYLNDGAGAFADASAVDLRPSPREARALAVGDVDGDGDRDLVFGTHAQDRLYLNDGTGLFHEATVGRMPAEALLTWELVLGDVDADGDDDLVAARSRGPGSRRIGLYRNDGSGTFTDASALLPVDEGDSRAIELGDVDGDGDLDLVIASIGQPNRLYLNDGRGAFVDVTSSHMPLLTDGSLDVGLADVDADGDLDLVTANAAGAIRQNRLLLNDGSGRFVDATAGRLPFDSNYTGALAIGDVDGDGDLDVVFGNYTQDRLYLNDGSGSFTDATAAHLPVDPVQTADIAMVDFDGDGHLDLVLATGNGTRGRNRYLRNNGRGSFLDSTAQLPVDNDLTSKVRATDVDGDGDQDLVFANADTCRVHRNLLRQLSTPWIARSDRPFSLEIHARHGLWSWATIAQPMVSDRRVQVPLPGIGTLGIDTSRAIVLPPLLIPRAEGFVTATATIPRDPSLVGVDLFAQVALVRTPVFEIRLTCITSDVVGRE